VVTDVIVVSTPDVKGPSEEALREGLLAFTVERRVSAVGSGGRGDMRQEVRRVEVKM
jgi:hypothetical protein